MMNDMSIRFARDSGISSSPKSLYFEYVPKLICPVLLQACRERHFTTLRGQCRLKYLMTNYFTHYTNTLTVASLFTWHCSPQTITVPFELAPVKLLVAPYAPCSQPFFRSINIHFFAKTPRKRHPDHLSTYQSS